MHDPRSVLFQIFNEIGIINQLSIAALARRLPDGLHPSQFVVLGNLARLGDGKTPAALAQAFQVPKASMTNTLMQLERRALIDVRQHAQDGRKKQVYLTDAGCDVYLSVISGMEGPLARLSEGVEGLEEILPVLMALRTRMDANRDP